ncbi:MAG: DNA-directed RNA polymerase subunit alpha [Patescibacteria group bacterium]
MHYEQLSETLGIKKISETDREGVFEIEGLYTGYGVTIGNALRRVLLSSLPGAAVTQFKIKGINHEFSTVPGILEDVVEIMLNLKRVRFRIHTAEPQVLTLKFKGEGKVTAQNIEGNANVEVINSDVHIVTVTEKSFTLEMELTVEQGLGYVPAEMRRAEKLPIGVVAVDSIFSPVINVNFTVENMRVGDRTDYNRMRIVILTDGSITPSQAFQRSAAILKESFEKISGIEVETPKITSDEPKKPKKASKKNS